MKEEVVEEEEVEEVSEVKAFGIILKILFNFRRKKTRRKKHRKYNYAFHFDKENFV